MCGCGRSKAKNFNQRRNAKIISARSGRSETPAAPESRGVSQAKRDMDKRRRNIIRKTFGK